MGWRGDGDFERLHRRPDFGDWRCDCRSESRDGRGVRSCGCSSDGDEEEEEEYGTRVRRDYASQFENGTASQYPHDNDYHASTRERSIGLDPWTHQPAYPMNEQDFPSIERSNRDTEAYHPVHRSWGRDFQRALDDAGYGGDGFLGTPMSRWERESRRERPWDGVGGVYPGDLEWSAYGYGYGDLGAGAGEYDVSAGSPEYWGSDVADAGTGRYGSRRLEYWGSNVADVGNDRAYAARTSSRTRR